MWANKFRCKYHLYLHDVRVSLLCMVLADYLIRLLLDFEVGSTVFI